MPSVITTASGISASMASITASLANFGGTKTTETSAPVSLMASSTVPNTVRSLPSMVTVWPALRALTPPTMFVPDFSILVACFMPSEPVRPWTMTLLFSLRKIDIALRPRRRELGGLVRRTVHCVHHGDQRVVRLREDAVAFFDVVAVQTDDQRLAGLGTQDLQRLDDAGRDRVAGGDAAEDVDEHALHVGVVEDDVQPGRHHLGRRAAADVEEVGGLHPAVLLARVRHDVQSGHDEPGAVADDADLAVQLDVVEVLGLRLGFQRVLGLLVDQGLVARLTEGGVLVEGDLAVEGDDLALRVADQRVDLDQGGVLGDEGLPQLHDDLGGLVDDLRRELARGEDLDGLRLVHAGDRVDRDLGQRLGTLDGELLDLHAAFGRRHRQEGAVRAVQQEGEVVLLGDVRGLGHQHAARDVALDVQAENGLCLLFGLIRRLGELDAARLAAATGLHLGLDDDLGADLLRGGLGFFGGIGHRARQNRYSVGGEEIPRLVLVEVHYSSLLTTRHCGGPLPDRAVGPVEVSDQRRRTGRRTW